MADKRITQQSSESDNSQETRARLSNDALDHGRAAGRDQIYRTADSGDRAQFRQQCGAELGEIRRELQTASGAMRQFNMAAEQGAQPGTPAYEQSFKQACDSYMAVIQRANSDSYDLNRDGSRKIDPISGKPVPGDLMNRVTQERQLLNGEINSLQQISQQGRPLTEAEMKQFGVNSSDARAVLQQKCQDDMMLKDLQRSVGYAEANFGLALIRSSVGMSGGDRSDQITQGQMMLMKASQDDSFMMGPPPDPNFMKHYSDVMRMVEGQGGQPGMPGRPTDVLPYPGGNKGPDGSQQPGMPWQRGDQPQQPGQPGRPGDLPQQPGQPGQPGIQVLRDQAGHTYVKDGQFTLPTGRGDVQANPFQILRQTEANLGSPLTPQNIQGFKDAITAADSIDRVALSQRMAQEQAFLSQKLGDPTNGRMIQNIQRQEDTLDAQQTQYQKQMMQLIPQLMQSGPNAINFMNEVRKHSSDVNDLLNWERSNQQVVNQFRALPGGGNFMNALEAFTNNKAVYANLENSLQQLDPQYKQVRDGLNEEKSLYYSSEDARSHFVRAIVTDPRNNTPENAQLARQTMSELAQIDPKLINDPKFQEYAQGLQMRPQDLVPQGQTTDRTGNPSQLSSLGAYSDGSTVVSRAADAYSKAMQGQMTPDVQQAFQQAMNDARQINPQAIAQQKQVMDQALQQAGWDQQKEQTYTGLQQAVDQSFAAIDPTKRNQLTQLLASEGQIQNGPQAQQQLSAIENQLQQAGQGDPTTQAWLQSRVQLAQFAQQNPDAMQARLKYEQGVQNLMALQHAPALIEGMYGTALLKSGDANNAKQYLSDAGRDPAVAQLMPDVGQAIQQVGRAADQNVNPGVQQYQGNPGDRGVGNPPAQNIGPGFDTPQPVPTTPARPGDNGLTNLNISPQAQQALSIESQLLSRVQQGASLQQQMINIGGQQKSLDQAFLETMQGAVGDPNGRAVAQALYAQALAQTGDGNDAQRSIGIMRSAMTNPNLERLYPLAGQLENYLGLTRQPGQQQPGGDGRQTGQPGQPGQVPTDNSGRPIQPGDQGAGQPQQPGQQANNPLFQIVPGYQQLVQANQIMGQVQDAQQAMKQADPLFDQAVKASDRIDLPKVKADFLGVGQQLKQLQDTYAAMTPQQKQENPAQVQQMQQSFQQLSQRAEVLNALRIEPTQSRLLYGVALNHTAAALYEQAKKDQAHKDELTRTADQMNEKAVQVLGEIGKHDPDYAGDVNIQKMVNGAIEQAKKHETIDQKTAVSLGYGQDAQKMVDFGRTPFGAKGGQPLFVTANIAGSVLGEGEKIPVIGSFIGGASNLAPSNMFGPAAAMALAEAKNADPKTGQHIVEQGKLFSKDNLVHGGIDLVAGPSSVYLADSVIPKVGVRVLANTALKDLPLENPLVKLGVSWAADALITKGLDSAAHATLNTDQLNTAEWLSHSTASWGATWAVKGMAGVRNNLATGALEEGAVAKAVPTLSTDVQSKIALDGAATETQRLAAMSKGLNEVRGTAGEAFDAARKSQYRFFDPRRYVGKAVMGEGDAAAAMSKSEYLSQQLGTDAGSRLSYFKPSNIWSGLKQETLQVGENGALNGSVADMNARAFWGKNGWTIGMGAVGTGIYGTSSVNPFLVNPETGKNYTLGDTVTTMGENAAWGGVASGITAPLAPAVGKFAYKIGVEWPIVKPFQWIANPEAGAVLKEEATGKFGNTLSRGFARVGEGTYINPLRRSLGTFATETVPGWLPESVTSAASRSGGVFGSARNWLTAPEASMSSMLKPEAPGFQNFLNQYSRVYARPFALPLANVASDAYAIHQWNKIDQQSDAILKASKDQAAKDAAAKQQQQQGQQQQTQGGTQQPGG